MSPMDNRVLRIGFIGASSINFGKPGRTWNHASRIERMSGVQVVGIATHNEQRGREILEKRLAGSHAEVWNQCKIYTSDERMLQEASLDLVLIGIAPDTRGSFTHNVEQRFIEAGVHTFVEKPLSVDEPEQFLLYARAVEEAIDKADVVTATGYMLRYNAAVLKMKELIAACGGKVMAFESNYYATYSRRTHKYWWNVDKSGGPVVEQATHFIDLARYLVGEVDVSTIRTTCLPADDPTGAGQLSNMSPDVEEGLSSNQRVPRVTASQWRFKEHGVGSLLHTVALHGRKYESHINVLCDGLRLTLLDPYEDPRLLVRDDNSGTDSTEVEYSFSDDDMYMTELATFIDAIRRGDKSLVRSPYTDAVKTYQLSWAIRRAVEK